MSYLINVLLGLVVSYAVKLIDYLFKRKTEKKGTSTQE